MSVLGEFTRLVNACIGLLDASDAPSASRWADALRAASSVATHDLVAAAERVLALSDSDPSIEDIEFAAPGERQEFQDRCDHMLAIVRVITGRPAGDSHRRSRR
jgi:hypothetical protein